MNALATDQAKRLAEAIWEDERLKGKITAGLFIGEGKDIRKLPKNMGETHIIENRDRILESPPDILLTNFKMLDYGLMRHNYQNLWAFNFLDPSLLQFLILDELHTYDGAQGTDVANLIRRLKLKLEIPKGQLCPVGTSATMGSGEDSVNRLITYASRVFGEDFTLEAVITENRQSVDEFFKDTVEDMDDYVPRQIGLLEVKDDNKNHFFNDPQQVYEPYFSNHKNVYFINTSEHKHIEEYEPSTSLNEYMDIVDFKLHEKPDSGRIKIHAVRKLNENKARHICPQCNSENTLNIIGTRVATLSSIVVSQVLSSNLDLREDKYRKILAFTNSVQDAAHQAGFVESRNYRFTFRASLQKVLNEYNTPMSLSDLQEAFIHYWKKHADESGAADEEAYYYRFFPADYKGKVDIENDYRSGKGKKLSKAFKEEFDERMRWEIVSEYGYNAAIGRTLEKSGASAVKFDALLLDNVFEAMQPWLVYNNLAMIEKEAFIAFLNGILHRIRMRGGIDHTFLSKFRSSDLKLWSLNWNRDNRHFLNRNFGPRSRLPKLVAVEPHNRGVLDSTFTTANNWYRSYYMKSFQMAGNHPGMVNDFFKKLFETLEELNIVNKSGSESSINYALEPAVIIVENRVKPHLCDSCGSILNLADSDTLGAKTPCLDYTCRKGYYKAQADSRPNYYQLVYNRKRSPRIYAAEHTGLLERKDRENKEIEFKERPRFNSLNAIVATSTLEMGINIGTLNAAINNAVPPLPSNFLQRVGRAGRDSGSALITSFAQSKAHDLFYYEEPLDMMEGEVTTPGCFLEAKEILFRHFLAFCIDNWSKADSKNNSIPGQLISLRLYATDLNDQSFFTNRLITYIKAHENDFLARFSATYKPDLNDSTVLGILRDFLVEDGFYLRIKRVFEKLKNEYLIIQEKRQDIDNTIKEQKLAPSDEERKMLEKEKSVLWGIKRQMDKRSVLEHLINIGLLPNYAFPETGVTLNARVWTNQAKASDSIPHEHQLEIVRPASVAIREFAPGNYFYSQGYKLEISGINTFDWKDPGVLICKRFCSNCDHIEVAALANQQYCPKCNDASWSSAKNEHVFVKLNNFKSVNARDRATLDHRSDDRDASHYRISRHIKFDYNTFQGAWGMKDIPFGIEYIKNVKITDINLGLSKTATANKISINKHENVPSHGFVTCLMAPISTCILQR